MSSEAWHLAILIPARDEEHLIGRCLRSLVEARRLLPSEVSCDIIVVSDSSSDRTQEIAEDLLDGIGLAVPASYKSVGMARALAGRIAMSRYAGPLERCWLANTDADCEVPASWLIRQLSHAQQGWAAVAGIVEVDSFEDHDAGVPQRFRDSYITHEDGTHPHVHGANLGVRAEVYMRAGGWPALATAEDHDLWARLRENEALCLADAQLCVLTSGRRVGRAPSGFAGALSMHNEVAQ